MYFQTYWTIKIFIYLIIKLEVESTGPDIILLKLS